MPIPFPRNMRGPIKVNVWIATMYASNMESLVIKVGVVLGPKAKE